MCRGWVPNCKDEITQPQCKFTTLAMCNNSCSSGTCSRNTSTGCYDCNITTTSCTYSSASACVSGSKGCSSCAKGNDGCYHCSACSSGYYRTVELTTIDGTKTFLCTACPANGTCNGTSVTCKAGYELRDPEGVHLVGTKECVEVLMPVKDGACPAGTTLSDDKCCCLNN